MSPRDSDLFVVTQIEHAGRGIVANHAMPANTIVYESNSPAAHVVFWEYRKEVCAQCFLYDRGRKLPVRLNSVGKAFCSNQCLESWKTEQGASGLETWEQLHQFVQMKAKCITNNHSLPSLTPKPAADEIKSCWDKVEETAAFLLQKRTSTKKNMANHAWSLVVDPDILGFLLAGSVFYHRYPQRYHSDVLELAMDSSPYRSTQELQAYCNSYLQLTAVAPLELLPNITASACQSLISAASHNSFGIRAGSEDGDEYLGYGLYPGASYFNHSCRPNIGKKRVGATWDFRTLKDIAVDEQCCITYLGGDEEDMTLTERRSRLKLYWGFECACERCMEEGG